MKTGIVLKIKNTIAVVMENGGEFVEIRAKSGWKKGDVIILPDKTRHAMPLYAAAACFILLLLGLFGGYRVYSMETLLISMDVNPSLELSINPLGRVIAVTSYNEDAAALLNVDKLEGQPYQEAINILLNSDILLPYLESNDYLEFAVYSKSAADTAKANAYLNTCTQSVNERYPQIQAVCRSADEATAAAAHGHHMSLGKYLVFLELQELEPELQIDDYANCGIGEIRRQIRLRCHYGNGQTEREDENAGQDNNNRNSNGGSNNHANSNNNGDLSDSNLPHESGNQYQNRGGDQSHNNNGQ